MFDEGGDPHFGIVVPDLPGCISAADSFEEARHMVKEAIEVTLESIADHGETIPEARSIETHMTEDADYFGDAAWGMVEVRLPDVAAVA